MGDIHFPVLLIAGGIFILLFAVGFIGMKFRIPGVVLYILRPLPPKFWRVQNAWPTRNPSFCWVF